MSRSSNLHAALLFGRVLSRSATVASLLVLSACGGGDDGPGSDARYTVTVAVSGSGTLTSADGSINCGTQCSATLQSGSSLTLSASPASGFGLQSWGGACAGTTGSSCTVTVSQATNVSATFAPTAPQNFSLAVTTVGTGSVASNPAGINCGATCTAGFAANAAVTLTATPAAGQQFGSWSGACSGTAPTCSLTMSAARSTTATFVAAPVSHPLNLTIIGNGSVTSSPAGINCTASCTANFNAGTSITLTASPAAGFSFANWGGACSGSGSTCTVVLSAATAVSATFQPQSGSAGWNDELPISAGNTGLVRDVRVVIDAAGNATAAWAVERGADASIVVSRSIAGGAWSAPLDIDGSTTELMASVQLAVDPASGRIAALWLGRDSLSLWGNTFAPGTGWGSAQLILRRSNSQGEVIRNHRVAIDGLGEAVAVWDMRDTTQEFGIFSSRYVLASGWSQPVTIEQNSGGPAFVQDTNPIVAMLGNGRAVAVWQSSAGIITPNRRGFWTNTLAPASGWGTATELIKDEGSRRVMLHELKADLQGNAILAWSGFDFDQSLQRDVHEMFAKRLAAGSWVSTNTAIGPRLAVPSSVPSQPFLSISGAGQSVLGWKFEDRALRASVASAGGVWGAVAEVKAASNSIDVDEVATAIDNLGNALAAWIQRTAATEPELWISRLNAGGSWSAPSRHQQTPPTLGSGGSGNLALAMNDRGDAVIVWYQLGPSSTSSLRSRYFRSGR